MTQIYASFVENVFQKYPALKDVTKVDSKQFLKMNQKDLLLKGYMNFVATRKELYRLSVLIENYAVQNNAPLLASFENEGKFKYAEKRYLKIMNKVPKVWVIANLNNPFLAQDFPKNAQTISCNGTNLDIVWVVLTKGPAGPMGLVAEELVDGNFKGFFSVSPNIIKETISLINTTLKRNIDLEEVE